MSTAIQDHSPLSSVQSKELSPDLFAPAEISRPTESKPAAEPSVKEERYIKISLTSLSFEVKGYSIQDAMLLMRKAWWFYLLMFLALIALVIAAICLKESLALVLPTLGAVRLWLGKRPP